jgi:hypothetical protein
MSSFQRSFFFSSDQPTKNSATRKAVRLGLVAATKEEEPLEMHPPRVSPDVGDRR